MNIIDTGREVKITTSGVFQKIRKNTKKIIVLVGSARSTKTYSIIQRLINIALENEELPKPKPLRILILRQRLTWLKGTVYVDFRDIMKTQFEMWEEKAMNKQENIYTLGNTQFVFSGLDYESGQKFHGAKSDYAWFNEANELDYPSVKQVLIRLGSQAFFDYNPNIDEKHWIETKIKARNDASVIHSTYKDNPFLAKSIVEEIERLEPTPQNIAQGTADETSWKIYGLGLRAVMKGLIFKNFTIVEELPKKMENECYGLDFGFTSDPTTLIRKGEKDGELYLDEIFYERGLTNIDNPKNPSQLSIEKRMFENNVNPRMKIWADSAEPKSIADLAGCGYNIEGVKKGSIVDGINTMLRYKINVTERSINLISELGKYKWVEDKAGDVTNTPISSYNHCFIEGTMISTDHGDVPIERLIVGKHKVLTRFGYKNILWSKMTCKESDTYISVMSNGVQIEGTGTHRIYTNNACRYLQSVTDNDTVFHKTQIEEFALWNKKLSLTEKYIAGIQILIGKVIVAIIKLLLMLMKNIFTGLFGLKRTVRYQMDIIYTILTETFSTMIYPISSAFQLKNIQPYIREIHQCKNIVFQGQGAERLNGISQKKVLNGTGSITIDTNTSFMQRLQKYVLNVVLLFVDNKEKPSNFAPTSASRNTEECLELTTKKEHAVNAEQNSTYRNTVRLEHALLRVLVFVEELIERKHANIVAKFLTAQKLHKKDTVRLSASILMDGKKPVYNLEVDSIHEYFANGILVFNCIDAARYSCIASDLTKASTNYRYDSCKPRYRLLDI